MTYAQLKQAVLDALIDTPTIVQNAVPRLVNQAIQEIEKRFNFKAMEANQAYLTTTGSRTLTPSVLPVNFKEYRGKTVYTQNLGGSRELDVVSGRDAVLRRWSTTDIGDPHQLMVDTGVLEVWPLPDGISDYTDGQYRINMPYWAYLTDLSNDADINWFTTNAVQYIINWATSEGFALDWDDKRADKWEVRAEKAAQRLIITGKHQFLSEGDTLVPHLDALEAPTLR